MCLWEGYQPALLGSSVVDVICRIGGSVGDAVTEMSPLTAGNGIISQPVKAIWCHLTIRDKVGAVILMSSKAEQAVSMAWPIKPWKQLMEHSVLGERQSFAPSSQRNEGWMVRRLRVATLIKLTISSRESRPEPVLQIQNPLIKGQLGSNGWWLSQ